MEEEQVWMSDLGGMFSSSYGYKWTIEEKVFGKNDEGGKEEDWILGKIGKGDKDK